MSIFKGNSIYKSGGGGGGYKDGGALVDAEFIAVENNAISSYDNVSRDSVNFYFEVADGEVLNAVVELTTSVNATVHVYIVQNSLFIPLGNVGGDTVNAGDEYNLKIVGDSFILEEVTPPQNEPEAIIYENQIYGLKKYGSNLWLDRFFEGTLPGMRKLNNICYYTLDSIINFNSQTFTIPSVSDWSDLRLNYGLTVDDLKAKTGWGNNGNNSSGLAFKPCGMLKQNNTLDSPNDLYFALSESNTVNAKVGYIANSGGDGDVSISSSYNLQFALRLLIKI